MTCVEGFLMRLPSIPYWAIFASTMALAIFSAQAHCAGQQTTSDNADVLFLHGNIYTASDQQPRAEAVAVKQGKILSVGSDADAQKFQGEKTKLIDLAGKTVLPGLTDSHCHLSGVGAREITLNLEGTTSLEDFLAKVQAR